MNTFEEIDTDSLEIYGMNKCTLLLDRQIVVDLYNVNKETGSFIIIDILN